MLLSFDLVSGLQQVECVFVQGALAKLLLFAKLDTAIQRKLVAEMFERTVLAGYVLLDQC